MFIASPQFYEKMTDENKIKVCNALERNYKNYESTQTKEG